MNYVVYRGYLFFSVKDRNSFHRVDTIGNRIMSGKAKSENIDRWCSQDEINFHLSKKKNKYSVYFMLLTLSGRSFIKILYSSFYVIPRGVPLPHSNASQYYVKREKCKIK